MPHQLCQFHYLREAARPIYEADRDAKVALKKQSRGIRPIERQVEGRQDAQAEAVRGYRAAVRSALTDDGRPPLVASGLKLHDRLAEVAASLDRAGEKGGYSKELTRLRAILGKALGRDRVGLACESGGPSAGCIERAVILTQQEGARWWRKCVVASGAYSARSLGTVASVGELGPAIGHFLKVTRSYWPGLFATYETLDLPRTNNALEQLFGSYRYHERRASGRKVASPGMVVRGSVRLIAATASRLQVIEGAALAPSDLEAWRSLRAGLDRRQEVRIWGHRFRRNPRTYLQSLEAALIQPALLLL